MFKSGLYHLAEQFPDVQLVPAWIDNVQRVMPKGEVVPVPILCTVTFGAPMRLGPSEEKRSFLDRARSACHRAAPACGLNEGVSCVTVRAEVSKPSARRRGPSIPQGERGLTWERCAASRPDEQVGLLFLILFGALACW